MTPPSPNSPRCAAQISENAPVSNNDDLSHNFVDAACYSRMEKKALWYFSELQNIAKDDSYLSHLMKAYTSWSHESDKQNSKLSLVEKQMQSSKGLDSLSFLQKLAIDKQLKSYLEKSLSYIFMRDLGRSIHDKEVAQQIKDISQQIQKWVRKNDKQSAIGLIDNSILAKKAKEYGVADTLAWLKSKLQLLELRLPASLDKTNGLRKLVKIVAGVVLHQMIELPKDASKTIRSARLDSAIRLGYCYGLTYPLIDDIQDSANFLSAQEKEVFNKAIRDSLLNGYVAELPRFSEANNDTMQFIYEELRAAFEGIKAEQSSANAKYFFEQAFVFFEAQNIDRKKSLKCTSYSDEALFLPVILKSAGSRILARDIVLAKRDKHFDYRTFCFGIYNQFNDDIKDLFDDIEEDNLTPYSYFYLNGALSSQNMNPYRLYWGVVFYLICVVYESDPTITRLFLERSLNAHKSLKNSVGDERYKMLEQRMLHTGYKPFDSLISRLVEDPNQVAWFDKLISREVSAYFIQQRENKQNFKRSFRAAQDYVEQQLSIEPHKRIGHTQLVESANYAVNVGGKRLRPVLAYITLTQRYNFTPEQTRPVLQLLEYMHTASLVFDDKPSQDNAPLRRGKPALHEHCNSEAQAELAGVYLIMKAVEVQTTIQNVSPQALLASINYAANTTQAICEGQLLDLQSHNAQTSLEELERICFLKTSLAIEAAIMIPAILGGENDIEKGHLKRYAKYLGLVFQLKDDLLDAEGDEQQLGKPVQQDKTAQKASFVTILGTQGAREKLNYYSGLASESLLKLANKNAFYEELLDFVMHRHS